MSDEPMEAPGQLCLACAGKIATCLRCAWRNGVISDGERRAVLAMRSSKRATSAEPTQEQRGAVCEADAGDAVGRHYGTSTEPCRLERHAILLANREAAAEARGAAREREATTSYLRAWVTKWLTPSPRWPNGEKDEAATAWDVAANMIGRGEHINPELRRMLGLQPVAESAPVVEQRTAARDNGDSLANAVEMLARDLSPLNFHLARQLLQLVYNFRERARQAGGGS